jgi:putative ATP-binding cassette transporter
VPSEAAALRLTDLQFAAPDGTLRLERANATAVAGQWLAITGPSGSGQTMLLRAVAGIWPFGSGRIEVPAGVQMMFVPQQAYLPQGSLRVLASYPSAPDCFSDEQIGEALRLLGLDQLRKSLDAVQPWEQVLSGSEQQLLAFARVLLNRPEWVFLDKSTSELDEAQEERVYGLLAQRLPHTTVISVAQRPSVLRFHTRHWTLLPQDHGASILQTA